MDTEQIAAKATAIKNATNHLLANLPDAMYHGGVANWFDGVRCDTVFWLPRTDAYLVSVAGVKSTNTQALGDYLRDTLGSLGYTTAVLIR